MNNINSKYSEIENNNDEELNLIKIFNSLKREKKLIFLITTISTLLSIYIANSIKPTFKGSFEIVVKDSMNSNIRPNISSRLQVLLQGDLNNTGNTQELILKSPSVLMPVFEYVKKEYEIKGMKTEKMDYKSWLKSELEIEFKDGSSVLSTTYFNNDKELIMKVLNKISKRYKNFSKASLEKDLINGIKFLTKQQKIYKEKSLKSLKELNKFSIENGLGDIDGFFTLSKNNNIPIDNLNNKVNGTGRVKAGMRFANQFALLEEYELLNSKYSSGLKENSKILKELRKKIEDLKLELKRPNEILLTYRDLTKDAANKETMLSKLENELNILKLNQAKQIEPWELISNPTIDKKKISPNKRKIVSIAFLISLITSCLISLLNEKRKGLIYDLDDLKQAINCKYLNNLYINNLNLSTQKFCNMLDELTPNIDTLVGLSINTSNNFTEDSFVRDLVNKIEFRNFKNINLFENKSFDTCENIILFVKPGSLSLKNIDLTNEYINLNKDKVKGWIFLDDKFSL